MNKLENSKQQNIFSLWVLCLSSTVHGSLPQRNKQFKQTNLSLKLLSFTDYVVILEDKHLTDQITYSAN